MGHPIDWADSLPFDKLNELPDHSGVYAVMLGEDVYYAGQAEDLKSRWAGTSHHRFDQCIELGPEARLKWLKVPIPLLDDFEKHLIESTDPLFGQIVQCYKRSYLLEIERLKQEKDELCRRLELYQRVISVFACPKFWERQTFQIAKSPSKLAVKALTGDWAGVSKLLGIVASKHEMHVERIELVLRSVWANSAQISETAAAPYVRGVLNSYKQDLSA